MLRTEAPLAADHEVRYPAEQYPPRCRTTPRAYASTRSRIEFGQREVRHAAPYAGSTPCLSIALRPPCRDLRSGHSLPVCTESRPNERHHHVAHIDFRSADARVRCRHELRVLRHREPIDDDARAHPDRSTTRNHV